LEDVYSLLEIESSLTKISFSISIYWSNVENTGGKSLLLFFIWILMI